VDPAASVPALVVPCLWTTNPVCADPVSIVALSRSLSILIEELTNIINEIKPHADEFRMNSQ